MKRIIFIFLAMLIVLAACARVEKVQREGVPRTAPEGSEETESVEIEGELNALVSDIDNAEKELDLTEDFSQEIALG